jgi:hypothetical protein
MTLKNIQNTKKYFKINKNRYSLKKDQIASPPLNAIKLSQKATLKSSLFHSLKHLYLGV